MSTTTTQPTRPTMPAQITGAFSALSRYPFVALRPNEPQMESLYHGR